MFIRKAYLIGLILGSFVLGGALGTVYDTLAGNTRGRRVKRASMTAELKEELDLDDAQKAQLDQILEDGRARMGELSRTTRAQYQAFRLESRRRIRAILSAEQAEAFDRMMKERDDRRKGRKGRRPGASESSSGQSG